MTVTSKEENKQQEINILMEMIVRDLDYYKYYNTPDLRSYRQLMTELGNTYVGIQVFLYISKLYPGYNQLP